METNTEYVNLDYNEDLNPETLRQ
jgi:hypothetical protein